MDIFYLIVAFIVLFISYKKKEIIITNERKCKHSPLVEMSLLNSSTFNQCLIFSLCWGITLPLYLFWKLLEIIYNKIKK